MDVGQRVTEREIATGEHGVEAGRTYFRAFSSNDAVLDPPRDSTYLVITGRNLPAISGERPSLWKASAVSAMRPMFPGRAPSRLESGELSDATGAALSRLLILGTADDTL